MQARATLGRTHMGSRRGVISIMLLEKVLRRKRLLMGLLVGGETVDGELWVDMIEKCDDGSDGEGRIDRRLPLGVSFSSIYYLYNGPSEIIHFHTI